jgi:hypothetical protein
MKNANPQKPDNKGPNKPRDKKHGIIKPAAPAPRS